MQSTQSNLQHQKVKSVCCIKKLFSKALLTCSYYNSINSSRLFQDITSTGFNPILICWVPSSRLFLSLVFYLRFTLVFISVSLCMHVCPPLCVCICTWWAHATCIHTRMYPWRLEESIRSPETEGTGLCELTLVLGMDFGSSARTMLLQLLSCLSSLLFSLLKKDTYKKMKHSNINSTHYLQLILFLPLLQNDKKRPLFILLLALSMILKGSRQKEKGAPLYVCDI